MNIQTLPAIDDEQAIRFSHITPRRPLSAWPACLILIGVFITQIIISLAVAFFGGMLGGAIAVAQGKNLKDPNQVAQVVQVVQAFAVSTAALAGGIAVILLAIRLVPGHLRIRGVNGAAWIAGSLRDIGKGFGIGTIVAFLYCAGAIAFVTALNLLRHTPRTNGGETAGPLTKMALTPGLPMILWVLTAVMIAPFAEELLFRGVLYSGFRRSFGPLFAGLLTTGIFLLCHITEIAHFYPAALGISGLAAATLWLRLRTDSIGPAIAAHFAYNSVIAGFLVLAV